MDTQTVPQVKPPPAWGEYKSYDEANKAYKLLPEDQGYVLRIEECGPPAYSPFVDLDDKGQPKPPAIQTLIKFTVVGYLNDNPVDTMIGQQFTQFYRISMHTKANFYKLAKAAFGGDIDPAWKPRAVDLEGRLVSAVIRHKDPNDQGQVYPKIDSVTQFRGNPADYANVTAAMREDDDAVDGPDVPF